jgi:1,4-alpha-glucan branching enzyme
VNLSAQPVLDYAVGVPAAGRWKVRLNSDSSIYAEDFADHPAEDVETTAEPLDGFEHRIITGIAPYSLVILSQDPT